MNYIKAIPTDVAWLKFQKAAIWGLIDMKKKLLHHAITGRQNLQSRDYLPTSV